MTTLNLIKQLEQQIQEAKDNRKQIIKTVRNIQKKGARFVLTTDNNLRLFEEVSPYVKREPYLSALELGVIVIYPYYKIKEDRVLYYPSGHEKDFEGFERSLIETANELPDLIPTDDRALDTISGFTKQIERDLVEDLDMNTNILDIQQEVEISEDENPVEVS